MNNECPGCGEEGDACTCQKGFLELPPGLHGHVNYKLKTINLRTMTETVEDLHPVRLVIEGFETVEQAKHWAEWYEGQGEQDWPIWMECRRDEGADVSEARCKSITIDGNTVTMRIY